MSGKFPGEGSLWRRRGWDQPQQSGWSLEAEPPGLDPAPTDGRGRDKEGHRASPGPEVNLAKAQRPHRDAWLPASSEFDAATILPLAVQIRASQTWERRHEAQLHISNNLHWTHARSWSRVTWQGWPSVTWVTWLELRIPLQIQSGQGERKRRLRTIKQEQGVWLVQISKWRHEGSISSWHFETLVLRSVWPQASPDDLRLDHRESKLSRRSAKIPWWRYGQKWRPEKPGSCQDGAMRVTGLRGPQQIIFRRLHQRNSLETEHQLLQERLNHWPDSCSR